MIIVIAVAAFLATSLGGLFALRFKDRLHLILGFSAGAVVGVAFFDLLPEAIELGRNFYEISTITAIAAAGFVLYLILDRWFFFHCHEDGEQHNHHHRGRLGAGSLSFHSFLDGLAIGLSFQVSAAMGLIVATAVLAHDFSDGINTVNMVVKSKGTVKEARRWLVMDALAPVLGILSTFLFTLPESTLSLILALFAGFFLYIGASDLLPESHHSHPTIWTTIATVAGVVTLYAVIAVASF